MTLSVILLVCICFVAPVKAEYVFQLTDASGVQQSSFIVANIGQTVDVNVWLKQVDTNTLTWEGLASAGVRISYPSTGIAEVLSAGNIARNPAFDDSDAFLTDVGSDYSTLNVGVSGPFCPVYPELATPNSIWLGTFTFTGLSLGSVQITAGDDDPDSSMYGTVTGMDTALDPDLVSVQATINIIPEPSGLALLVGLALAAGLYLWRCRRRSV